MSKFDCDIFCGRANELFGEAGQIELAQKIGISQGVISAIKNKKAKAPSADTVCRIAEAFEVSTDWLLGLSDNRTTDQATKELCKTLGLSDASIDLLKNGNVAIRKVIDFLFAQHFRADGGKQHDGWGITYKSEHPCHCFSMLEELASFLALCELKDDCTISLNAKGDFVAEILKGNKTRWFELSTLAKELPYNDVSKDYDSAYASALNHFNPLFDIQARFVSVCADSVIKRITGILEDHRRLTHDTEIFNQLTLNAIDMMNEEAEKIRLETLKNNAIKEDHNA